MSGERQQWDVVVIGAGPAGTVSAGLFAQAGHSVLVLEKEHFPRFHIGESLLPAGLPVLERLGVEPRGETFLYKRGARFVCEASGREQTFAFENSLAGESDESSAPRHAWQVDRAGFDTQLRDRAVELGAEVRHGETVVDAGADENGVWVETRTGTVRGRYLIDASGQSRLMARRSGTAVPYRQFGTSSVFTHYEGVGDEAWAEFEPWFDIRIMLRPEGWGWIIPLTNRRLSVGMVARGKITAEELEQGLLAGPTVQRLTAGAQRGETRVVGNFSYRNTKPSGVRYATVGDAYCFLDPVFSSGVTLALRGAESTFDAIAPALAAGEEAREDLLDGHHQEMDRAHRTFAALIDRFYNSRFAEQVFLRDVRGMPMRAGVLSVLAGDVWRTGNDFQEMLLKARRYSVAAEG